MSALKNRKFETEFRFKTSRSSGRGGQFVNKVETKCELIFNIPGSSLLTDDEKIFLKEKLAGRLSAAGDLRVVSQTYRSQLKNKSDCIRKFYELLEKSLKRPKIRKPVKISKEAIEKRHKAKRLTGEKKQARKKIRTSIND